MLNSQVSRVLVADNPWLEGLPAGPWLERFLPDPYVPRSLRLRGGDRVCLVVGPRQAGKSTLIWRTLADSGEPCLFINCEEPSLADWLRSPAEFLADIGLLGEKIRTVFFEEIQRLPEAGLFLKGLVDRRSGVKFFATGSSSFDLEAGTRESLAGRASRHLLLPLSLGEVGSTFSGGSGVVHDRMERESERHQVLGGYPTVVTGTDPRRELAALVEAFVVRDVSDRFRIRNPRAMRTMLELAASQIGNLCNFSEWASIAGVHSTTVSEYCRLLEETHILRLVRPFVGGKRAEITSAPKVFFVDNGVRNQLFGGFSPISDRADRGPLLENLVFSELAKTLNPLLDRIHHWRSRSGAEVDFVAVREGRIVGVEVKSGDTRGRLSRSAQSFITAYRPRAFVVVSRHSDHERDIGETRVVYCRPWQVAAATDVALSE
jgi:predicted AAA+ superfamily ATPase